MVTVAGGANVPRRIDGKVAEGADSSPARYHPQCPLGQSPQLRDGGYQASAAELEIVLIRSLVQDRLVVVLGQRQGATLLQEQSALTPVLV